MNSKDIDEQVTVQGLASVCQQLALLIGREKTEASTLYIVGTPIGNLADMSPRALGILAQVDIIAAEDTRHSLELLRYFGLQAELLSYHEHNARSRERELITRLQAGESVALITDAGMPAISDPGEGLINSCLSEGVKVRVVPGPSAVISAVALSGLDSRGFSFEGFLPVKGRERNERLRYIASLTHMAVLYEAPHRLRKTLLDLQLAGLGSRRLALCRELTKQYEEVQRFSVDSALLYFGENTPKGEYVLVLAAPDSAERAADETVRRENFLESLKVAMAEGLSTKDLLARFSNAPYSRNELKRLIQSLK